MKICFFSIINPKELIQLCNLPKNINDLFWQSTTPASDVINEMRKLGHEISVISFTKNLESPCVLIDGNLSIYLFPIRRFSKRIFNSHFVEVSFAQNIIDLLQPDIIHTHWAYEHAYIASQIRIENCIKVLTCHDDPFLCAWLGRSFYQFILAIFSQILTSKFQNISVVSAFLRKRIKFYHPFKRISIIPNIVRFVPRESNQDVNLSYSFATQGNSGRLKNIIAGLKAFKLIKDQHPSAKYFLYGMGLGEHESFAKKIRKLKLDKGVFFMGFVSRDKMINHIYENISVYIHTSLIETQSLACCEMQKMGIPCIAHKKAGAVPYTLNYGRCGVLCNINNSKELSLFMLELVENNEKRLKIINEAYEYVEKTTSAEVAVTEYLKLYSNK